MQIITLDFESFYDQNYSLSKLTTEEYVRDPRFEIIGVGIAVGEEKPKFFTGSHAALRTKLLEYEMHNCAVLAHHSSFDMAILNWILDIRPKLILDSLSMARGLHGTNVGNSLAKLGERYDVGVKGHEVNDAKGKRLKDFTRDEMRAYGRYCKNDVTMTYKLFKCMADRYTRDELKIIDQTVRMFTEPVFRVDRPLLEKHVIEVRAKKEKLLTDSGVTKKELMSNEKFAELLRGYNIEPPMKVSKTTGLDAYAFAKTDDGFKELLEHDDIRVQILAAARVGNKSTLEETRTQRLIDIGKRGLLPVPLLYCGAHTTRWSGTQKINFQNLPSRGKGVNTIKRAVLAPLGYVIIESDSSSIEARVLAWFAGQQDLVEDFTQKRDVYKKMASHIYGIDPEEVDKPQRDVGKETILGCGFQMGGNRFQAQLKMRDIFMELEKAEHTVKVYRETYSKIPELWEDMGEALVAIMKGQTYKLMNDCVKIVKGGMQLPSGLVIRYDDLRYEKNPDTGRREMVYTQGRKRTKIYSGKATENCIAEGTLVLTNSGWTPIESVTIDDLVHDGLEFVSHGGKVYKSVQPCVTIDGIHMTNDHKVLTDDGWESASQQPRPYRPDLRNVNCITSFPYRREEMVLGSAMRLWQSSSTEWFRSRERGKTRGYSKLRMCNSETYVRGDTGTWDEWASGILGMAQYAGPLSATYASGLEELWWSGYNCMRSMGRGIHELLGRYGEYLPTRVGAGQTKQQWRLHTRELSLGLQKSEYHEQADYRNPRRRARIESDTRYKPFYDILSSVTWMGGGGPTPETRFQKPVYDLINCGPRHRFVVLGTEGPFIVHNCIQGLARCAVGEQALLVAKRYKWALTVHDSLVVVAPEAEAEEAMAYTMECMRYVPTWAEGLPLNCEAGYGRSYGEC